MTSFQLPKLTVLGQWSFQCLKTPCRSLWKVADKSKPRRLRFSQCRSSLSIEDF